MNPKTFVISLLHFRRGLHFARALPAPAATPAPPPAGKSANPLEAYFDANKRGPGIWKWRHYFDIYHHHLQKFRWQEVHIAEVGIYSGGSLGMWRHYFGEGCRVYGIDIEPACKAYERDGVRVFIGDQSSRAFWVDFRQQVPRLDILLDDGSHVGRHQIVTLEEMLPHLAPGGVYLCEDIHGWPHHFSTFLAATAASLHSLQVQPVQQHIGSIHVYPYLAVIEKPQHAVTRFTNEKHGTEWQPFFDARDQPKVR